MGQQPLLNLQSEDVHTGSALEFDLSRRWLPGGDAKESTWRMTATGHLMVCGHCNCIGMGFAMLEVLLTGMNSFLFLAAPSLPSPVFFMKEHDDCKK